MLHKCASVSVGSSTVNGIHTSIGHGLLDRNGRRVACGDTVRLVLSGLLTSYVREDGRMVAQEQHSRPGSKCQQRAIGLPESQTIFGFWNVRQNLSGVLCIRRLSGDSIGVSFSSSLYRIPNAGYCRQVKRNAQKERR